MNWGGILPGIPWVYHIFTTAFLRFMALPQTSLWPATTGRKSHMRWWQRWMPLCWVHAAANGLRSDRTHEERPPTACLTQCQVVARVHESLKYTFEWFEIQFPWLSINCFKWLSRNSFHNLEAKQHEFPGEFPVHHRGYPTNAAKVPLLHAVINAQHLKMSGWPSPVAHMACCHWWPFSKAPMTAFTLMLSPPRNEACAISHWAIISTWKCNVLFSEILRHVIPNLS